MKRSIYYRLTSVQNMFIIASLIGMGSAVWLQYKGNTMGAWVFLIISIFNLIFGIFKAPLMDFEDAVSSGDLEGIKSFFNKRR